MTTNIAHILLNAITDASRVLPKAISYSQIYILQKPNRTDAHWMVPEAPPGNQRKLSTKNKRWQASGFNQPDRPSYHIRAPHGVIKQVFVEANQRRIISWTHASLDTQSVNVQNSIRPQHAYNMHVPSKWHVRNDLTKTSYSFEIGGLIFLICELCLIFPCGSTFLPLVIFGSQAAYFGVGGWKLHVQTKMKKARAQRKRQRHQRERHSPVNSRRLSKGKRERR